jgi:hypothetical protein
MITINDLKTDMMLCIKEALPESMINVSTRDGEMIFEVVPSPFKIITISVNLKTLEYLNISKIKVFPLRNEVERGTIFKGLMPTINGYPDLNLICLLLSHHNSIG